MLKNKNIQYAIFGLLVGIGAGVMSFFFLKSLNWAITLRENYPWIIFLLPFAGAGVAWVYHLYGKGVEDGNNLILDEIHEPQKRIPFKIVPLIFITTTISHLFGASVGREGVAVQMGAGLSDFLAKFFHSHINEHRKIFLMMGISAGFASIFGAPLAGTIFGMEVLAIGSIYIEAIFPCMIAGLTGYFTAYSLGLHHVPMAIIEIPPIYLSGILSAGIAGVFFGLAARLFSWSMHYVKEQFAKYIVKPVLRPLVGGTLVLLCYYILGDDRYLSLGEKVIHSSFSEHVYPWDFLGKIWMTALSIGSGFKGGEVMPLFYVGATLGNSLSYILWLSYPLLAALGYVAVFSGAANAPLTGIILAMEFFGSGIGVYASIAVIVSYLFSGSRGIYSSQRGIK